ncbi:MAG: tetratricopeptide repeat protein [Candidatus Omnitrophota bacterium]
MSNRNIESGKFVSKSPRPYRPSTLVAVIAICLLGILIYSNTFHASFHFDDEQNILTNAAIRNLWNLKAIWDFAPTRFFTYLSLSVNYHLHQLSTPGYHIFNLAVHLGSAILVYWFILLIFSTPYFRSFPRCGLDKSSLYTPNVGVQFIEPEGRVRNLLALFSGLLFVCHPVQIQAVTYIIQRTASLATFFYLLSVCLYLRARLNQAQKPDSPCWLRFYAGSILSAVAALFTKEMAVTLPFMLLLCEVSFFRDNLKNTAKRLAPFFLILLIVLINIKVTGWSAKFSEARLLQEPQSGLTAITPAQYLFTQFRVIVTYIRLLLVPVNQNLDYDYPISQTLWQVPTVTSLIFLLLLLTAGFLLFRKYRLISFSIFWFFLTIAPESSIFPIRDVIYEHRLYLPLVGYSLFLPVAAYVLFGNRKLKLMIIILLSIIACYSVMTYSRNRVWKDELTLWSDVMRKFPNKTRPAYNLGVTYAALGRYQEAIDAYKQAIRIKPDYAEAHYNLGVAYFKLGRCQEAIDAYKQAIRLKPDDAPEYNNLGNVYARVDRYPEAIDAYKQAIRIKPDFAETRYNLGNVYDRVGRYPEAIDAYKQAIRLKPDDAPTYNNLGNVYARVGRYPETIDAYKQAICIKPDLAEAHFNLGVTYLKLGDKGSALEEYTILKDLNGDLANKLFNTIYK